MCKCFLLQLSQNTILSSQYSADLGPRFCPFYSAYNTSVGMYLEVDTLT